MQPNEGAWADATEEEQALLDSLRFDLDVIVSPPQPADGGKVRVWMFTPEKRYSATGDDRVACLRKLAKRLTSA